MLWLYLELFYRLTPNNYTEKHKNIQKAYPDTEILIFGNSHSFYGLNPDHFDKKAFNIANVSQTLLYDKLLLQKHVDNFKNLKYIILNVEYTSLSQDDRVPELEWRKYFYKSQMQLEAGTVSDFDIKKYSLALAPRFKLTVSAVKKYFSEGTLVECSENGWGRLTGINKEYNNLQMGRNIVKKHEDGSLDFTKNVQRLKDMIEICRQRDIKVILVNMPVTSYYAVNVNKEKLLKIFAECTMLAKYNNVEYINLFQGSGFTNSDFHDTDHLNEEGAEKCSRLVSEYITEKF